MRIMQRMKKDLLKFDQLANLSKAKSVKTESTSNSFRFLKTDNDNSPALAESNLLSMSQLIGDNQKMGSSKRAQTVKLVGSENQAMRQKAAALFMLATHKNERDVDKLL